MNIPENVDARQDTTAEEILSRCNNEILKPMLTMTNKSGNKGAPSHPIARAWNKCILALFLKHNVINSEKHNTEEKENK